MKNPRALVMIGISIIAAFAAVWIAARWMSQETALRTSQVVVANGDIDIGSKLTAQMVRVAPWPAGSVPAGAVNDPARVVDRVLLTRVQKGEAILETKLAPEGAKGGLSAIVTKGRRAVTVKVNEASGVAGFLVPGSYVDVMVNTQEEGTKGTSQDTSLSKIVLEHILVLAVAQETSTDTNKPKVVSAVTLELSPEEAEKLDLARNVGELSLALRNQIDQESVQTTGSTKAKLLAKARVAQPAPPPAAAPVMPAKPTVARRAAPAVSRTEQVAGGPRVCVTVLTGVDTSRECF